MLQELRVGNFVYSFNPKTMSHDHVLKVKVKNLQQLENHPESETYQPIPLTPETISKCISLKLVDSDEWRDCYETERGWHITYTKYTEALAGIKAGNFYQGNGFRKVEYIHDLQNLYFCTSFKKELEFIW